MLVTVNVQPEMLSWARLRSGLDQASLARYLKISDLDQVGRWETTGEIHLSKLEKIAQKASVPVGYFFLDSPPSESLPIPDFRRVSQYQTRQSASPELLDTIRICQFRQDWYQKVTLENSTSPLVFVNSVTAKTPVSVIANSIRTMLNINAELFLSAGNLAEALKMFIERAEAAGILIMRSGVVGNNNRRKLDVGEFRGFTLNDEYSPLVFINSVDAVSAQLFTLAHELTHIWLGQSGVSNISFNEENQIEVLCNKVASEVLLPTDTFTSEWDRNNNILEEVRRISRRYKLSSQVILIKALQNNLIDRSRFEILYEQERMSGTGNKRESSGGNFYYTQRARLSNNFMSAVVYNTLEGKTTYVEAFQLLGIKSSNTFNTIKKLVIET